MRGLALLLLACAPAPAPKPTPDGTPPGPEMADTPGGEEPFFSTTKRETVQLARLDLGALKPAHATDAIVLFNVPFGEEDGRRELARIGTPCATAIDHSACQTAFDTATESSGFDAAPLALSDKFFVVTQGDTVSVINDEAELRTLLAPIDDPVEVAFLIAAQDYRFVSAEAAGDGYDAIALKLVRDCAPVETHDYTLHVSASGDIGVARDELYSRIDACI